MILSDLFDIIFKHNQYKHSSTDKLESLSKSDIIKILKLKDAILEINQVILKFDEITELMTIVLDKVMEVMEYADFGSILLLDQDDYITMAVCRGYGEEYRKNFRIHLYESFFWKNSKGNIRNSQIINNIRYAVWDEKTRDLQNSASKVIKSSLSTPILIDGKLYGLINIDSTRNYNFKNPEREILEYLRNQMEIGISNHILYERTVYLSRYDNLTHVYNRRYFEERFENYLLIAKNSNQIFHVVMFDIDGLKQTNDIYGHLAGDELIKAFATTIKNTINEPDVFARLAGDEFVAILLNTDIEAIKLTYDNVLAYLKENLIVFEQNPILCSFSYGISEFPIDGLDYNRLLKVADTKMYEFKNNKEYSKKSREL